MMQKINKRNTALLISLVLILTAVVGSTLAYLIADTQELPNQFTPSKVTCAVQKNTDGTYTIKNTGNTDAYIRVAVVVTWKSADGTRVWAQKPKFSASGEDWLPGADGYFYYANVVPTDDDVSTAIDERLTDSLSIVTEGNPPEGYQLSVEIVASAIQSDPTSAVVEAWNVVVNGTTIQPSGTP